MQRPPPLNEYTGFIPNVQASQSKHAGGPTLTTTSWQPDRVDIASITAQEFFSRYVATRTPCILTGHLPDAEWKATARWSSMEYLKRVAGHARVQVETRDEGKGEAFGSGRKRRWMKMEEFLSKVEQGDTGLYLSTQYDGEEADDDGDDNENDEDWKEIDEPMEEDENDDDWVDEDGGDDDGEEDHEVSEYCKPPLQRLLSDFPLRPSILKTLTPQQVNLWMGAADQKGVSSGLHHDFADNLYVVLQGRKSFRIFPPSDAEKLYLNGAALRVFPNGLVQYPGRRVRADGAFVNDVAEWNLTNAIRMIREARVDGDVAAEEEAMVVLHEAMKVLDEEDWEEASVLRDDYQESDEEDGNGDENGDDKEETMIDENGDDNGEDEDFQDDENESDEEEESFDGRINTDEPPSFSLIDVETLKSGKNLDAFPLLKEARQTIFSVEEGEMLYLPASWFHEVQSFPSSATPKKSFGTHMAFNYWFHPPTQTTFANPYDDAFWEDQWRAVACLIDGVDDDEEDFTPGSLRHPLSLAARLSMARPGSWVMRSKEGGKFLGIAKRATNRKFGIAEKRGAAR
ncbi:cupin-like domain-containing protein [Zopfochytrium polystomum]|nr:cupin-like domain-containing protein [Zopfochytrium polystomum]